MTQLQQNKPVQYQMGFTEFYKLKFVVNSDVLIPRPETELLVEQVIKAKPSTVLEIGTGSGCIAISIAKNLKDVQITAVDISKKALQVANKNAKLHHVEQQITFKESDLLSFIPSLRDHEMAKQSHIKKNDVGLPRQSDALNPRNDGCHADRDVQSMTLRDDTFDWIVANLPYIPSSRIETLDSSVKDFEPILALDGGEDGFDLYRRLFIEMIQKSIYPHYFIGEIDTEHAAIAKKDAERFFPRAFIEIKKDLTKRDRFLVITF